MQPATTQADGRVVVGVDGSPASVAALAWAAEVAERRGWTLDVVTAWPDPKDVFVHEVPGHYCAPRGRAIAAQYEAFAAAHLDPAHARLETHVENTHPVDALVHHSSHASLLVVGSARPRSRRGLRHRSVGERCARESRCPVVVIDEQDVDVAPPPERPARLSRSGVGR